MQEINERSFNSSKKGLKETMTTNLVEPEILETSPKFGELSAELEKNLVQVFKLLSDETRLKILLYKKRGKADTASSRFLARFAYKKVQFKLEGKPHPKCRRGKKKLELHKIANKLLKKQRLYFKGKIGRAS